MNLYFRNETLYNDLQRAISHIFLHLLTENNVNIAKQMIKCRLLAKVVDQQLGQDK